MHHCSLLLLLYIIPGTTLTLISRASLEEPFREQQARDKLRAEVKFREQQKKYKVQFVRTKAKVLSREQQKRPKTQINRYEPDRYIHNITAQ